MTHQLPEAGFIRQRDLLELIPFSPATLWRRVASGAFPQPVKLGPRVTAWRVEDVRAWIEAQGPVEQAGRPCRI